MASNLIAMASSLQPTGIHAMWKGVRTVWNLFNTLKGKLHASIVNLTNNHEVKMGIKSLFSDQNPWAFQLGGE